MAIVLCGGAGVGVGVVVCVGVGVGAGSPFSISFPYRLKRNDFHLRLIKTF